METHMAEPDHPSAGEQSDLAASSRRFALGALLLGVPVFAFLELEFVWAYSGADAARAGGAG